MNEPTSHAFFERLRAKASSRAPDDLDDLRDKWLENLDRLFDQLRTWLEPGVKDKTLRLEDGKVELNEESLGTYVAPTLTIHLPGHLRVRVEPVGMEVLGGHAGRVDLLSGPNKARLLLEASGEWLLGWPDIELGRLVFDMAPLTEERFLATLDGLTA